MFLRVCLQFRSDDLCAKIPSKRTKNFRNIKQYCENFLCVLRGFIAAKHPDHNLKTHSKYLSSIIAVFIFVFIYELIIHGFLLNSIYRQTPSVWRTPEEMQANMPILMLFQLALAVVSTFIFSQWFKEGGTKNGLIFGLYFGIIAAILNSSWYLFLPVSTTLGWGWFVTSLAQGLGIGLILGSIYRNKTTE